MERERNGQTDARVSILLHPLSVGSAPLAVRATGTDGTSGTPACVCTASNGRVQVEPVLKRTTAALPPTISRAERAHYRLSWAERLARNARTNQAERITLSLFGLPDRLATFLGLASA